MGSDKNSPEISRSLERNGWLYRKDPIDFILAQKRSMGLTAGTAGAADYLALKNGYGCAIEAKYAKLSFGFDQWTEEQREWARWCEEDRGVDYFIWLTIGPDPPHYDPEKYSPRKSWLVPSTHMLQVESTVLPIQKTLVYRAGKGHRREIQDNNLDAVTLLSHYELLWRDGYWHLS